MGEITEFVQLYIENADVLEEQLDEMSLKLVENIQNQLYGGHGRITGNLRDSIQSDFSVDGLNGVVRAYIGGTAEEYGWAVNDGYDAFDIYPKGIATYHAGQKLTSGSALWWPGADHPVRKVHHPGFGGYEFMEAGLEETVALYR